MFALYKRGDKMKRSRRIKKSRAKTKIVRFFTAVFIVSCAVCILVFAGKNVTQAVEDGNDVQLHKYYKTIEIQPGDTLWSIAKEYKSGDYRTTKDYVKELMSMNDLPNDNITSGQKLLVAYFLSE